MTSHVFRIRPRKFSKFFYFMNPRESKVNHYVTSRIIKEISMRELEQISRGGKFTPSENYTGRKIRFLRSSTKYTHRGEAQRSRGEGEGEGIRRETSLLSTHSRCVSRWKGPTLAEKIAIFQTEDRDGRKSSRVSELLSLPCNYHVFSRLWSWYVYNEVSLKLSVLRLLNRYRTATKYSPKTCNDVMTNKVTSKKYWRAIY